MKIEKVVYHDVVFSKNPHLIDLKLLFKSCAGLSGGRYAKKKRLFDQL